MEEAFAMFLGDKPLGLFADKLPHNLKCVNEVFGAIAKLFKHAGNSNYERLPDQIEEKNQFANYSGCSVGLSMHPDCKGSHGKRKTILISTRIAIPRVSRLNLMKPRLAS